jgi:hypothetical protein
MYLLDVNVLLAFAYNAQQSHLRVLRWIEHIDSHGPDESPFASCSIVEFLIPEYFGNPDEVREPHVAYGAAA